MNKTKRDFKWYRKMRREFVRLQAELDAAKKAVVAKAKEIDKLLEEYHAA